MSSALAASGQVKREEGQHENLGVPEDVPLVCLTGQCAGADGHALVLRVGSANEVVDGKAQGALGSQVALYRECRWRATAPAMPLVALDQRGQLSPDRTLGVGARRCRPGGHGLSTCRPQQRGPVDRACRARG